MQLREKQITWSTKERGEMRERENEREREGERERIKEWRHNAQGDTKLRISDTSTYVQKRKRERENDESGEREKEALERTIIINASLQHQNSLPSLSTLCLLCSNGNISLYWQMPNHNTFVLIGNSMHSSNIYDE